MGVFLELGARIPCGDAQFLVKSHLRLEFIRESLFLDQKLEGFNMKKLTTMIGVLPFIIITTIIFAHPGRTDSKGGHHDRKNGGYHYHNSGNRATQPSAPTRSTNQNNKTDIEKTNFLRSNPDDKPSVLELLLSNEMREGVEVTAHSEYKAYEQYMNGLKRTSVVSDMKLTDAKLITINNYIVAKSAWGMFIQQRQLAEATPNHVPYFTEGSYLGSVNALEKFVGLEFDLSEADLDRVVLLGGIATVQTAYSNALFINALILENRAMREKNKELEDRIERLEKALADN